ncbi:CREB-regulated transcription coactivator 1-like isoform X4 [Argiope bruennichi]|uniref:CREB-regulated transcription coactivator 1-like isoform X4 n=1 Tax=Argiope bruennichi TaxID=94029 RepID=UPI0024943B11|nr:CREB-regulated transcription coactivator 1-like isoform X4 [Argiope bruennichi]
MANPRKFSEKIALHNQKQAEETAAFEQIMKEVIGATRGPKHHHLHINQSLGAYRAGSLPNVNQIGNNSIDLQSALNSLEDMKQGREVSADRMHRERGRHSVPHQSRRFAFENKRIDVSPYNSSYLSPPPDTNWRRTNSDSALHQSAMNTQENYHGANTPPNNRNVDIDGNAVHENDQLNSYWDPKKQQLVPTLQQSRPKSCEVPGINIYPSQDESGSVHVPISSNTGSLPDLTNLHFPPPLTTPLDVEDQTGLVNSCVQMPHSPPNTSTLSPSSLQHQTHILGTSLSGGTLITTSPSGGSRHSSPGPSPSPSSRRRHHHNLTNLVIGSGSPRHHGYQHTVLQNQVRYKPQGHNHHHQQQQHHHHHHHHNRSWINMEGLTMDTNALSLETYPQQTPQFGIYPQQQQQPSSQTKNAQTFGYEPTTPTSPTLPQLPMGSYRSTSPADHSCSAPTSPVSHSLSPSSSPGLGSNNTLSNNAYTDSNYYVQHQQTNALQHQLEQFKMVGDLQLCECFFMMSDNCSNSNNVGSHNNTAMFLATVDSGGGGGPSDGDISLLNQSGLQFSSQLSPGLNTTQEMDNTMLYSITSLGSDPQLQSPTLYTKSSVISSHQTTPQTPQTPTSIPDIILTAPSGDEPILRQDFAKELGCAISNMCGSFDSEFFTHEEALRAGLGPIDFDGLQILTDPDMPVVSDPTAEDSFHLEGS